MATNLTNNKINITYKQLLHVDGGITGTPKIVYDGDGTASALKVGQDSVVVDNIERAAESRIIEVATDCKVKILTKIVAQGPLAAVSARRKTHSRIDAPEPERNTLSEVPQAHA